MAARTLTRCPPARAPAHPPRSNAVICCTGPTNRLDPLGPYKVDFEGTSNLVAAAKEAGARKFVFVSCALPSLFWFFFVFGGVWRQVGWDWGCPGYRGWGGIGVSRAGLQA